MTDAESAVELREEFQSILDDMERDYNGAFIGADPYRAAARIALDVVQRCINAGILSPEPGSGVGYDPILPVPSDAERVRLHNESIKRFERCVIGDGGAL